MGKTANKTAKPSPRSGVSLPTGAHAGNTGGKKGRSGRKPEWLKKFCDDLLADPECKEQVRAILKNKDHTAFARMWATVADRAHGKPKETVNVNATLTYAEFVARSKKYDAD